MAVFELLDEFNYHRRLQATDGLALVLFSSPGCGVCRVVEARLPGVAPAGVRVFKVDVQTSLGLARALEVFHLPSLFLYRDGHYHARLDTALHPGLLRAAIDAALAAPAQEEP